MFYSPDLIVDLVASPVLVLSLEDIEHREGSLKNDEPVFRRWGQWCSIYEL